MTEKVNRKMSVENKDSSSDIAHMSMESIGNIDFFKCNKCPYMALTAKDIQFHWQTSHSKNYKIANSKSITVKCPGCSGIFNSEVSLKTHLRSHHKMCAKDINKLVQNLIKQFKKKQEYIDNMEVIIDGHPDMNQNNIPPMLIEVPPDPKVVIVNNNPPINVINIGGSSANFIISTNNGINNSNQFVINTNNDMQQTSKTNSNSTSSYDNNNQSIIKNNYSNLFNIKPNNKTNSNVSSILYNKLKSYNSVSNILGILPTIPQHNRIQTITNYPKPIIEDLTQNSNKASLCFKKKSHVVAVSKGGSEKTEVCLKSSTHQTVASNKSITCKAAVIGDIFNNNPNQSAFVTDVTNNLSATIENDKSNNVTSSTEAAIFNTIQKNDKKDNGAGFKKIKLNKNKSVNENKAINCRNNGQNINKCGVSNCTVNLTDLNKLEYHRSCHLNGTKELYCPECKNDNISSCQSLHNHLWKEHSIDLELNTCDICQYKTFKKQQLFCHIVTHYDEKKFKCEICFKAFKSCKQVATHRLIHKIEVTCDLCDVVLKSSRQLYLHKKTIHEKKKDFYCDYCDYSSATKDSLRVHIIRHMGTKHLKCSHCPFQTGNRCVLRRHIQRHTMEKTYNCKYCSYSCIHSTSFKSHILSKHADKKDEVLFSCQQCPFTSFNKQKLQTHSYTHKDGTFKILSLNKNKSKRNSKSKNKTEGIKNSKSKLTLENEENDESVGTFIETPDVIIDVTDQNSTSMSLNHSNENTNVVLSDGNFVVLNDAEVTHHNQVISCYSKDNANFFSNVINSTLSNEVFTSNNNNMHEGFYDCGNKIENIYDSNNIYNNINSNVPTQSSVSFVNQNNENYNHNVIDTDDNDTYFNNYDCNLVINEEVPSSENTTNFSLCAADNATDGLTENNMDMPSLDVETDKSTKTNNSIKVTSNIFVKDIVDLASSNIKTIPPNIYASDIQKSASHTPIILINPKTQTNNRIMGANIFTSNIINSSYSESSGSSQMLHLPIHSSNSPINNTMPRKKPKISVKSNLILKGPDRLGNFNNKSNEFNVNNPPFSLENYNLPLDFINNSQTIDGNNINCTNDLISNDIYNSEHNYLSNYLLNSDFTLPNIQTPMISNNANIIQNNLNTIQTIPIENNLTDMSDVKLENKPYLSNQTDAMLTTLIGTSVHNNSNMYYNPPIHVPIKFEQKMDMLSSFANQNNAVFEDNPEASALPISSAVEEVPQSFDNGYNNQSLYPFEDNYYFENDFITETLDGQEIIVLDDTWSDVKSLPNRFKQNNQFVQLSAKDKPQIISEVQIAGNDLSSNSGSVKKIGHAFEFPVNKNIINNESDFPVDQQDIILDLEEQY